MRREWFILGFITLLEGLSGFGRTSAISPLLSDLSRDLHLTYSQISGSYFLANLMAGFCLPFVGRSYDLYKLSYFLCAFILLFSFSLIGMGCLGFTQCPIWINCLIICLGYTFIRTSLHAYSVAGKSFIATHFESNRGFITGLSTLFITLIASSIPWICFQLHRYCTWYTYWICVGCFFLPMLSCFFSLNKVGKNTGNTTSTTETVSQKEESKNLSLPFLFIMGILFFKAFQNTGIAFHLVPMCKTVGVDPSAVTFSFMPIAVVSICVTFAAGHWFRKLGMRCCLVVFLLADILFLSSLKMIAVPGMLYCFVLSVGFYWGLNNILGTMIIPLIFGVKTIGQINGFAYACISIGSSVGPFYFGIMKDYFSYELGLNLCIAAAVLCFVICCFIYKRIKPLHE